MSEQLFEAALSVKPMERSGFLDDVCDGDRALRQMVEELLDEDARAGSFLLHSPLEFLDKGALNEAETPSCAENGSISSGQLFVGRFSPGQVLINRFVIVRFIARGGMGEVYEAEDRFLQGAHVALKTILPKIADDPSLRQRFEREVLLAREVIHPNLCPIYDIFHCEEEPSGVLFLTMKLLPGETLAARLKKPGAISTEEGVAILSQMVAGLAAIHAASIIHRDIKPNNILLDGNGADVRLCITDFGLARAFESETTLPGKSAVAGTPDYMAPELFLGQPPTQASDLFALGVVLHEVFTCEKPVVTSDSSSITVNPRLSSSSLPSPCVQLVIGCLDRDPKRRCEAFDQALEVFAPNTLRGHAIHHRRELWTRRRFVGTAFGAACVLGGGAWWKWDQFENLFHPLPRKRFVTLLNWPRTSDVKLAPVLTGVLSAMKSELSRLEAFDRDLFVITPEDGGVDVSQAAHLQEICDPLGANLVLAAAGLPGPDHFQLFLRVLDPSTSRALREKKLVCSLPEITALPGRAVQTAASMLDLSHYQLVSQRTEPQTQSAAAFTAFQSAEDLRKQPNDKALDAAIDKYKEAVELDPRYALAHARLAQAYLRLYSIRRNPAALDLARGNCQVALALNPNLVDGHLALASALETTGNVQGASDQFATALALDPSNPKTLIRQAQLYTRLNRWADAERAYQRVLKARPNDWLAYNELGFTLHGEGKFQQAIQAFRIASLAAPKNSMALSNLGVEYLQIGDFAQAIECMKNSRVLDPDSDEAAANTSLALRFLGKYEEALPFALKAVDLNPAYDTNWLELGECYSSLHNREKEAKAAYLRAAKEIERHLKTEPNDGPGWMLFALYQVKSGNSHDALALLDKADTLAVGDMDSQLYMARILELLGKRDRALAALDGCFRRGATALQLVPFPDISPLQKDPRYRVMIAAAKANYQGQEHVS